MKYRLKVTNVEALGRPKACDLGFELDEEGSIIDEWDELYVPLYVELTTIEELQDFIERYGRVVLNKDSIEIYNGYRE